MNHAMATCPKQADHICAQDLISTLFGNHAQCKFNLHLTLTSFFPSYCLCCLPVTLFEGVRWHLYIIDSSVCSTLSLIQLMEHSVESTGCMGRKVLIITTTYLGFQYLTHTWMVWMMVQNNADAIGPPVSNFLGGWIHGFLFCSMDVIFGTRASEFRLGFHDSVLLYH